MSKSVTTITQESTCHAAPVSHRFSSDHLCLFVEKKNGYLLSATFFSLKHTLNSPTLVLLSLPILLAHTFTILILKT